MTSNPGNIWKEIRRSQVLIEAEIPALAARFQQIANQESQHEGGPLKWLVAEKLLSEYQAEVLEQGFAETLSIGNYLIVERISGDDECALFRGRHQATRHPVWLFFLSGSEQDREAEWQELVKMSRAWQTSESPAMVPILDVVQLAEYRFVVIDDVAAVPLGEKVPKKTRLSVERSLRYAHQLCDVVRAIHEQGVCHGRLGLDLIVLDQQQSLRLLPPFLAGKLSSNNRKHNSTEAVSDEKRADNHSAQNGEAVDTIDSDSVASLAPEVITDIELRVPASDAFSIGMILHRMIAGKYPRRKKGDNQTNAYDLANASKLDYPSEVNDLIKSMVAIDPRNRLTDLDQVMKTLESISSGTIKKWKPPEPSKSLVQFREYAAAWQPESRVSIQSKAASSGSNDSEDAESKSFDTAVAQSSFDGGEQADERIDSKRKGRSLQWLLASGVSAAFLSLIVVGIVIGYQLGQGDKSGQSVVDNPVPDKTNPSRTSNQGKKASVPAIVNNQELVGDDGNRLWESPTGGEPIQYRLVPPSPRIVITFRLAELSKLDEPQRILTSIDPDWANLFDEVGKFFGVTAAEIETLTVSLHSEMNRYRPCFAIDLLEPMAESKLMGRWSGLGTVEPATAEGGNSYLRLNGQCIYFIGNRRGEDARIESFVMGPEAMVLPVILANGNVRLDGILGGLASQTDRERHFNLLALQSALFNEEGQALMAGNWAPLNRALAIRMDDRVQGIRISTHFDKGFYWEVGFDHTVDLKPVDLQTMVTERWREAKIEIDQTSSSLVPHPYWANIHARFDNMVDWLYRDTRIGIENNKVLVNGWLPMMAPHNLLESAETTLAALSGGTILGPGQNQGAENAPTTPTTVEELLETRRDLKNANPPDLNELIADFQDDIRGDFPSLPFEFKIVINGTELGAEGITRNQRPSSLDLSDKSIREILTSVLFLANPDKNATSPKDPLCKLVWVIKKDSNSGNRYVEITTRSGAAKSGAELPVEFQ